MDSFPRVKAQSAIDFYKSGHIFQYPKGTEYVYSNFTCRSDAHFEHLSDFDHKVVNFGLQGAIYGLHNLWHDTFFNMPKDLVVKEYRELMDASLGVGAVPVDHIAALHDLQYLPIRIKALPEGARVNLRVPLFTIVNTDPRFFWITNYLETQISAECWKPLTSATIAYEYRRMLEHFAELTGADKGFIPWQGHDFSMRGMSGIADAAATGAGHLLSFTGTDTIPAIEYLKDWYTPHDGSQMFVGGSVPATEHSVMCMGEEGKELETFQRLITEVYPRGIVSIVSDTWDFWRVMTEYAATLKPIILAREPTDVGPGKVVFRPDSGDPVRIICGDPDAPAGSPAYRGAVECLWDVFGGKTTPLGFRVLDEHVGLIYGDSISLSRAEAILRGLQEKRFASSNIVFGIGSYTYQRVTRDTFGTAIKATWGQVNGEAREIFKSPKTDDGTKYSARGLLRVDQVGSNYILYDRQTPEQEQEGLLQCVYENGNFHNHQSLAGIRARLLG